MDVTFDILTSLLGQVAPSPKHLAWTFWMPKESTPAAAARIEAVFILLFGLWGRLCFALQVVSDRVEDDRGKRNRKLKQEVSFIHTFGGTWLGRRACCGRRRISCNMFSFSRNGPFPILVSQSYRLSRLAGRNAYHFSWHLVCSEDVLGILRTRTAPRKLFVGVQYSGGV